MSDGVAACVGSGRAGVSVPARARAAGCAGSSAQVVNADAPGGRGTLGRERGALCGEEAETGPGT